MSAKDERPEGDTLGKGELFLEPSHYRSDLQLAERALRHNFPISDETKSTIIKAVEDFISSADEGSKSGYRYNARVRLAALRVAIQLERTNLESLRIAASLVGKGDPGYQPRDGAKTETHEHKHLHLEGGAQPPAVEPTILIHVDDWYGPPDEPLDALPKAGPSGTMKRGDSNGEPSGNGEPKPKGGQNESGQTKTD